MYSALFFLHTVSDNEIIEHVHNPFAFSSVEG